jgi:hypothetical protein
MWAMLLVACSGGGKGKDDEEAAAIALAQTDDCKAYLSCASAVDPGDAALYAAVYGPDGECWSGTATDALACEQTCRSDVAVLSASDPLESACWPDGVPSAQLLLGAVATWDFSDTDESCYDLVAFLASAPSGPEFDMDLVFESGFHVDGLSCSLGDDLGYSCDPLDTTDNTVHVHGAFDSPLVTATLHYVSGDTVCDFSGILD